MKKALHRARRRVVIDPFIAPADSARMVALRYVNDRMPGISRKRSGRGFAYFDSEGKRVVDAKTLLRIRSLVIPPAWTNVWICAIPNGHLQACGRDARGRKQYRYHPKWSAFRNETKYGRLTSFAHALPRIRRRVRADLTRKG